MEFEVSISSATKLSLSSNAIFFSFTEKLLLLSPTTLKLPTISSPFLSPLSKRGKGRRRRRRSTNHFFILETLVFYTSPQASSSANAQLEDPMEVQVVEGYSMTQFHDKIINVFLNEKPKVKEWRKYLVLREEWNKYKESFYNQCRTRTDKEIDATMKQKLISLVSKVNKIDEEIEKHNDLLKEIQESPTDVNAVVAKRRSDFTGEFFRYITLVSETCDSLEDRDAVARLAARCLSAVSAYDKTLESVETLDAAQAKFDDILNSPSVDVACEKIKSLAKAKELDSSLILLINSAWAAAKESKTMKNEILKRFSALATAFSPGDEHEAKDPKALYTTPKELHKWIMIMLDAYNLNKEDTDIREVEQMSQPIVIQRLFILKETIEEEYLEKITFLSHQTGDTKSEES